jgi:hypothetical protein
MNQNAQCELLLRENRAVSDRARTVTVGLTGGQMSWLPPDGGWSIGQVFEHLCLANDSYLARIRLLTGNPQGPVINPSQKEWRPTLMGRLLVNSFRSTRKLPMPRIYRPATTPRANVVAAFIVLQNEMTDWLEQARNLDWTRLRTSSPATSLIRINLGDCFAIMVTHSQRHLRQIERVRALALQSMNP